MKQYYLLTLSRAERLGNDVRNVIIYHGTEEDMPKWTSKRGPFNTEFELRKACSLYNLPCKICGGLIELAYVEQRKKSLENKCLCFTCDYWDEVAKSAESDKRRVIIKGNSYYIGQEQKSPGAMSGFGGRVFRIKRFDSEEIITTRNLWGQGEIPNYMVDKIPNNAEFV